MRKTYWAVVVGAPPAESGIVDAPLLKRSRTGSWRMVVDPAGQPARTAWRVLGRAGGLTWLELTPHTGRTHQIRVHCAHLGCPILHDPVYGTADGGMLHLLARSIALPMTDPVGATAPPPAHMNDTLTRMGFSPPPLP